MFVCILHAKVHDRIIVHYWSGGVSAVNAAGVAVVETFSVIINAISLTSTPGGVDNPDVGGATE